MFDFDNSTETQNEVVSESAVETQAQPETNALDEFMAEPEAQDERDSVAEETTETETEQTHTTETEEMPKGIKGRILAAETKADKRGYERGKLEAEKAWATQKADYEARLQKLAEMELDADAAELARKEKVSVDFAKRLLRAERGLKAPVSTAPEKVAEPSKTELTLSDERRNALNIQAENIKNRYGFDVMQSVTEEDAKAILEGTMELWDVAMRMRGSATEPKQHTSPKPVRTGSNTAPTGGLDFATMTDEEFDRFNSKIDKGAVFKPR